MRSIITIVDIWKFLLNSQKKPLDIMIETTNVQNDLIETVSSGLKEFCQSMSLQSPLPFADFCNLNHNFFYTSGIHFATCNGVVEKEAGRQPTQEEISQTIHYFQSKKLPFIWWHGSPALENHGFQFGGILKGVALDITERASASAPSINRPEIKISLAKSEEELQSFTDILIRSFGLETSTSQEFTASLDSVEKQGEQLNFLGYYNDLPVAIASLHMGSSVAGIWYAATLPEYRRKGLFTALIHTALHEAKKRGYVKVMAILMPKGMAWGPLQHHLFHEVCDIPFYIYGANPHDLEKSHD